MDYTYLRIFALTVVHSACIAYAQQPDTNPMSVCDVIRDRNSLDGKVVQIRGIVERSQKLFVILPPAPCADISDTPQTVRAVWVNLPASFANSPRRQADKSSLERLYHSLTSPQYRTTATLQGRISSARDYMVLRAGSGLAGTGFGYLGLYPVELEFHRVVWPAERGPVSRSSKAKE